MSSTLERIKQRQEYLKKKRGAYTELSIASFLLIPCAVLDAVVVGVFVVSLYQALTSRPFAIPHLAGVVLLGAWIMLMFGWMTGVMAQAVRRAHQEAMQLPYVPPINADTLPAEEVLVRGSEKPTQEQGQVLLRSAQSGQESTEQQLLRSSPQE